MTEEAWGNGVLWLTYLYVISLNKQTDAFLIIYVLAA